MKKLTLLLTLLAPTLAFAQLDWFNYSTSFQGSGKEGVRPTLVTAIPYNGIYDGSAYTSKPADKLPIPDSLKTPNGWPVAVGVATTIDPDQIYILVPGAHPSNAARYDYRVFLDGSQPLLPWSPITRFTDSVFRLNDFKPVFGLLGGFRAGWGHSILVDLREKATGHILARTMVYWREARPAIKSVYTAADLPLFIQNKGPFGLEKTDSATRRRTELLTQGKLVFGPNDNNLIFSLDNSIYQRAALEYQLTDNGRVNRPWKPNDFDNGFIFLHDLAPGTYTLDIRFRAQRQNPASYTFTIGPRWYDSKLFLFLLGALQVISAGAILLLFFYFRQYRKTRRQTVGREKLNLELRALHAQLNPHFVFNALSSIQGLVNKNDLYGANRYLSEFGHLLRESLAAGDKDFTNLKQEIALLDTYLRLEQLRFGFRYTILTAADVAPETEIPAFLLQPLVENAVKHGVSALHDQGLVQIRFSRQNGTFIAQVSDNGKGWDPDRTTPGYGLTLTQERIRLLNQLLKAPLIGMTIAGSEVTIRFSNWWT